MLKIELLSTQHQRKAFDCGVAALNTFLQKTARQHIVKGISRTFVLVNDPAPDTILGFFTLTACEVRTSHMPQQYAKKFPPIVPAAKLARLAVDRKCHGQGLGTYMMIDAMERVLVVSEHLGIVGFFVDAKDDSARRFYEKFGFLSLSDPLHLFLPVKTLRQAFEQITSIRDRFESP